MEAIVMGLVFAVVLGMRVWAAKAYSEFYDALPEGEQKALVRRAMSSGS